MVTITNKKTGISYEVTPVTAEKIKNSASGSKFIIPKMEKVNLPELEKLNEKTEAVETISETIENNISEKAEGESPNEAEPGKPKRKRNPAAKVDQ